MISETDRADFRSAFRRRRARSGRFLAAFLGFAVAGCGPSDPLAMKVDGRDFLALSMWKSDASRRLTAQQLADFDEAVQEVKFRMMADRAANGGVSVDKASLEAIDGKTVTQVLQMGLGWEFERMDAERAELARAIEQNAQMRTRPGDFESKTYLSDLHDRQLVRLHAATDQVAHIRERMGAYGFPIDGAGRPDAGTDRTPREPASEDEQPVRQTPKGSEH